MSNCDYVYYADGTCKDLNLSNKNTKLEQFKDDEECKDDNPITCWQKSMNWPDQNPKLNKDMCHGLTPTSTNVPKLYEWQFKNCKKTCKLCEEKKKKEETIVPTITPIVEVSKVNTQQTSSCVIL